MAIDTIRPGDLVAAYSPGLGVRGVCVVVSLNADGSIIVSPDVVERLEGQTTAAGRNAAARPQQFEIGVADILAVYSQSSSRL